MSATGKFFIMIYSQNGENVMPMTTDLEDDVALFNSEEDARDWGNEHHFASAMGFDVYEVGGMRW